MFDYYIEMQCMNENLIEFHDFLKKEFSIEQDTNVMQFTTHLDVKKNILEYIINKGFFNRCIFIFKSDEYRFGEYFGIEDSKVTVYNNGKYSNYDKFLKDVLDKKYKHICKTCGEPYNEKCTICSLKKGGSYVN